MLGTHKPILTISILTLVAALAFAPTQIQPVSADSSQTGIIRVNGSPYTVNVTISQGSVSPLTFANKSKVWLNFTVSGTLGQQGTVNVTVCKTAGTFPPGQANKIKIYLNNQNYTGTRNDIVNGKCLEILFTVHFSTDQIGMDLTLSVATQAPNFPDILPLLGIASLLCAEFILLKRKPSTKEDPKNR